jgi:hypothetical protein
MEAATSSFLIKARQSMRLAVFGATDGVSDPPGAQRMAPIRTFANVEKIDVHDVATRSLQASRDAPGRVRGMARERRYVFGLRAINGTAWTGRDASPGALFLLRMRVTV